MKWKRNVLFHLIHRLALILTLALAAPLDPSPAKIIPEICTENCFTPYGSVIGSSYGVKAYSNCRGYCSNPTDPGVVFTKNETGFIEDVYTGIRWQCVEYARRWLVFNTQVTFREIESARKISELNFVKDLTRKDSYFPFEWYNNGGTMAPEVGDLLIWGRTPASYHGHVGVVVGVYIEEGYIELAEQNTNRIWRQPESYNRILKLLCVDGRFYVSSFTNSDEWMFSAPTPPIGWKRVIKEKNNNITNTQN